MNRTLALALVTLAALASAPRAQGPADPPRKLNDPYLPALDQARLRSLWGYTDVPFPDGLRFYDLPQVYQHTVILNDKPYHSATSIGAAEDNVNTRFPWDGPGGLHDSPKHQWRKASALFVPGEIEVWRAAYTHSITGKLLATAAQPLIRWRWSYPPGTIAADMLLRTDRGREWPFEIRIREKGPDGWDDGVAYRPFTAATELPDDAIRFAWYLTHSRLPELGLAKMHVAAYYTRSLDPDQWIGRPFKQSRLTATTAAPTGFVPQHYAGNMTRCVTCHSKAGQAMGYGPNLRGDDTVFSFHPFDWRDIDQGRYQPGLNPTLPLRVDRGVYWDWNQSVRYR